MSETNKRLAIDAVSTLPTEILHSILNRIPVSDAVKISMVSKDWELIWRTHPNLVFCKLWSEEITNRKGEQKYFDIIDKILLHHVGHIATFSLYIPMVSSTSKVDEWMLFLPRNGFNNLVLINSNPNKYKLTSSAFFSCPTLKHFQSSNCVLEPPQSCEGFQNLNKLLLEKVTFMPTFATSILRMPKLKTFKMIWCSGIRYLNAYATELEHLSIVDGDDFDLTCFTTSLNLKAFFHFRRLVIPNASFLRTRMSLSLILNKWPCLELLKLDVPLLTSHAGFNMKNLANKVDHLVVVILHWLSFAVVNQIRFTVNLIRHCVSLRRLGIRICPIRNAEDETMVINYFRCAIFEDLKQLQNLKTVVMFDSKGSRGEMLFIKLLLGHLPSLRNMIIIQSNDISLEEQLLITRELLQFPRVSSVAEVNFLKAGEWNPTQ